MTTLKDLLEQAKVKRGVTSGRALAELTTRREHTIDRTQVNAILGGTYKSKPGKTVLEAIAWLAGVPVATAYEAARLPLPGPPFAEELPPGVDDLDPHQRHAVITVIRAFLSSAEEDRGEGHAGPAAMNAPDDSPAPLRERILKTAARSAGLTEEEQAEEAMRRAMAESQESATEADEPDESDRFA